MTDFGTWGKSTSPYHRGERALHERYGRGDEQAAIGRQVHAPVLDPTQQAFLGSLDYVVVASLDASGRPWASMLFGDRGFTRSPDPKTIEIASAPLANDRLRENMTAGSPMSVVAIELATRRRIRANVTFRGALDPGLLLEVDQAYGNCPKYIQTRTFTADGDVDGTAEATTLTSLVDDAVAIVEAADTFFVASHNGDDDQHDVGGVDVNHRGGQPGFVKVEGDSLLIPDFMGNFAFNTLGNFLINPVAGLLFVDFASGDVLQLTGTAEILWEDDPAIVRFPGAQRGWRFTLDEGSLLRGAVNAVWEFGAFSQASLNTGTWSDVP